MYRYYIYNVLGFNKNYTILMSIESMQKYYLLLAVF